MKLQNMIFNTDYPVDKIVLLREITVTPDSYGEFSTSFAHGLGAVPYCSGVATNDNWQTTYPSGFSESGGQYIVKSFTISSDSTNVYIDGGLGSSAEVSIRFWGFFNETNTRNVPAPSTLSNNNLIMSTDFNYPALVKEGVVDASTSEQNITHNLGFVPFCQIWWMNDGSVSPSLTNHWSELEISDLGTGLNYYPTTTIDSTNLIFPAVGLGSGIGKFYYRIYGHDTSI